MTAEGERSASASRGERLRNALRVQSGNLKPFLVRYRVPLVLFFIINALLLTGYLWSRGGQATHVRVIADDQAFQTYVDGKHLGTFAIEAAPTSGGIVLGMEPTGNIPSLPEPRGIDSVRVTDASSGDVLLEDDFSGGLSKSWSLLSGSASIEDGVLDIQNGGAIAHSDDWTDVVVDVTYKNTTGASVMVRANEGKGVLYTARPFRQYDSNVLLVEDGQILENRTAGQPYPSVSETMKSMLAMVLRPYPYVFVLLAVAVLVVTLLQFLDRAWGARGLHAPLLDRWWYGAAFALSVAAFGVVAFLMYEYTDRVPHVQDDTSYVFQARIFASGHITAPPPPVLDAFDYARPPFLVVADGGWSSVYPFGQPMMLAIGEVFGSMWIIPPLLGAASVFLTFAIGRRLYDSSTGLLAAVLFAASPFFFMTASNFMYHTTATFFLLACVLLTVTSGRWPLLTGAGAGICFGLLFNTQTLSAAAIMLPIAGTMLVMLVRRGQRRRRALHAAGFATGALLMLGAYILYNIATRGDPFLTGYEAAGFETEIGFGGKHSVNVGILYEHVQLTFFLLVADGWPQWIGLLFVVALLALVPRSPWDYVLLACAVCLVGAYTWYAGHGIMYGPRYWFPALPFVMLLSARGAHVAADTAARGAAVIRRIVTGAPERPVWAARLLTYAFVAVLIWTAISGWLLSRDRAWIADFVPARAIELQSFNGADGRLTEVIESAGLDNALVLVENCASWQCYGTVFWRNSTTLDGDVVTARAVPERVPELLKAYPDREVYSAVYLTPVLVPYGFDPRSAAGRPLDQFPPAPVAGNLRLPTPTPTTTPSATSTPEGGADAPTRDARRRNDLETVAAALVQYRLEEGTFPEARYVQSLCRYPADAGCAVGEQLAAIPRDPSPQSTYYYMSDGETFTLFAIMETPSDVANCPDPRPPDLANVANLYCVTG